MNNIALIATTSSSNRSRKSRFYSAVSSLQDRLHLSVQTYAAFTLTAAVGVVCFGVIANQLSGSVDYLYRLVSLA